ncbi:MAG: aminotransferase class V-fold PLP-dependent enzyme [Bifidobacteriaceae bacterium]|jgi:cysteine desulfurase|nr:aminotransferase class V-fold PLP-dependent enzyme [Bifidobacteriaceae bacterium]
MERQIYLDYAAGAPLRPAALAAYSEADAPANPHAAHRPGRRARRVLDQAREAVAAACGAASAEVVFTAGGTEADGIALHGLYHARQAARPRPYVVVGATEHAAVSHNAELLAQRAGARVVELGVDRDGIVSLSQLAEHLAARGEQTALVSVMAANNETGAIQPVDAVVELAAAAGVPAHSDWAQAGGRLVLDFAASGLAAASLSAHKLGGPVGAGALLVGRGVQIAPALGGGGQERGLRSGTADARGAAGFAAALADGGGAGPAQLEAMLEPLDALVEDHPGLTSLTPPWAHLPGLRCLAVAGASGEALVYLLDQAGLAVSAGAACAQGAPGPSRALLAMGLDDAAAASALRVSLGHASQADDVAALVAALPRAIERAQAAAGTAPGRHRARHARPGPAGGLA